MKTQAVSAAFTTDKIEETKLFFVKYLNARITFDCGWYVNLEFGNSKSALQFISPRNSGHKLGSSVGLTYNFLVDDVDAEYNKLTGLGLVSSLEIDDHPWGDRGFAINDPNGISLYIYSEREPGAEFKQYYV